MTASPVHKKYFKSVATKEQVGDLYASLTRKVIRQSRTRIRRQARWSLIWMKKVKRHMVGLGSTNYLLNSRAIKKVKILRMWVNPAYLTTRPTCHSKRTASSRATSTSSLRRRRRKSMPTSYTQRRNDKTRRSNLASSSRKNNCSGPKRLHNLWMSPSISSCRRSRISMRRSIMSLSNIKFRRWTSWWKKCDWSRGDKLRLKFFRNRSIRRSPCCWMLVAKELQSGGKIWRK